MGFFGLFLLLIVLECFEFIHEVKLINHGAREGYVEIGGKDVEEDSVGKVS